MLSPAFYFITSVVFILISKQEESSTLYSDRLNSNKSFVSEKVVIFYEVSEKYSRERYLHYAIVN
jgi:hypothetical protein